MMSLSLRIASPATAVLLSGLMVTGITSTLPVQLELPLAPVLPRVGAAFTPEKAVGLKAPVAQQQETTPTIKFQTAKTEPALQIGGPDEYHTVRTQLRWVDVRIGENRLKTPDLSSRILLAQSAAQKANLREVGLSYRDVYGIINAETSWIPRTGASKDGTPNLGIAQFEPATAKALGLRNPEDPVEAVHVAALHLKEAAEWSAKRIAKLNLDPEERAQKLREGVSIYYNLSTKGRAAWDGTNTAKLPIETQRHIANARRGAMEAGFLEARIQDLRKQGRMTASSLDNALKS